MRPPADSSQPLMGSPSLPDLASTLPGKEEGREEELFEMLEFHEELRSRTESKASDTGKEEKYRIKT